MNSLVWFFFESTLALGGCLAVVLFVLLVHWRRRLQPRPLLIGLVVSIVLLITQALVVTRREVAQRIMRGIEVGVIASRPDAIAAALSSRFRVSEPEMDRGEFLDLVERYMQRVDVRTLYQRALKVTTSEGSTFEISVSYLADVTQRSYSGAVLSRWSIVFTREDGGWRILSIEPTMLQRDPIDGWSDLRGP